MIPEFLAPFAAELQHYALPTIKIKATPQPADGPASAGSKFRGLPFLPLHVPYPRDENGTPLLLLAQINLAELPATEWLPAAGLLQFYVPTDLSYETADVVLYLQPAQLREKMQQDFSFLPADHYAESPINCEHSLRFELVTEYGGMWDARFSLTFKGLDASDYEETLPEVQQQEFNKLLGSEGHKLGGYAMFTQGDPRDYTLEKPHDVQLLQIDVDEEIMFGDSGVAHFFISPQDLQNREFDKAYFYWDCC